MSRTSLNFAGAPALLCSVTGTISEKSTNMLEAPGWPNMIRDIDAQVPYTSEPAIARFSGTLAG